MQNKPSKYSQRLPKFGRSGEILPNPDTLLELPALRVQSPIDGASVVEQKRIS